MAVWRGLRPRSQEGAPKKAAGYFCPGSRMGGTRVMSTDYEKLADELMNKNGLGSLAANAEALKALADSPDARK